MDEKKITPERDFIKSLFAEKIRLKQMVENVKIEYEKAKAQYEIVDYILTSDVCNEINKIYE